MRSPFFTTFQVATGSVAGIGLLCLVVACSGTSTGTGTGASGGTGTSGSGGKGFFGGSGGSASTVPTSCGASATDDACTACLKAQCCSSTTACGNDAECSAIVSCASACDSSNATCNQDCYNAHPGGQADVQSLLSCAQSSCGTACGDSSSSTSGGTSGSSGAVTGDSGASTGCLADTPQDPSLCPNLPGKQVVKDCPNGPPSSDCVFSPMNLSGIYCCPN